MKKLLILGSISLLLLEQVGYAGASASRRKYSASSKAVSKNSLSVAKKAGGNADMLIAALGFKEADLKEWSIPGPIKLYGMSNRWSDESKYAFKKDASGKLELDEAGNKIKVELTADELEDQKNSQIDKVVDAYLDKYRSNAVKALGELQKDIQAFQEKFKDVKNTDLQAKIASLVAIAEDAAQRIYAMSIDEKVAEMLAGASLLDALEKAKFELGIADASSKDMYKEVIQQLQAINAELEKLKRMQGGKALEVAEKMLQTFEKNEDFMQADVYQAIVAQLKMDVQADNQIDNEVIARTAMHSPIVALAKVQEEVNKLRENLVKYKNYRNPKYDNDIKKSELDLEYLDKIIRALQLKIDELELDAATAVKVLLSQNKGDAKKALEIVKPPKAAYNPFAKAKPEKVLTEKEKLMVKQLEAMIKQAAQEKLANDPVAQAVAQAKARLAKRDMSNLTDDLKLIILSPFGMQDAQFSEETNAALQEKLQKASVDFKAVALGKDSLQQKNIKEQAIMKKVSGEVAKLVGSSASGVSEEILASSASKIKSGDYVGGAKEVAFDAAMNKLLNSFSSSPSSAVEAAA